MDNKERHLNAVEAVEPSFEDEKSELEQLEFLVRRHMQLAVEMSSPAERRARIGDIYTIAARTGLSTEALNAWYVDALSQMERPRGFSDKIEYATSAVSGDLAQIWPPAPDDIAELGHQALRHAIRAINSVDSER